MPKFAANLSFLFADRPFSERFKCAAAAGFKGVEYLFPYEHAPHDIADWLRDNALEQVLFNLSPGDWAAGERGLACLPHRQGEFAESVEQALDYAVVLDCPRVHCMAGLSPKGTSCRASPKGTSCGAHPAGVAEEELEETYVTNLRYAADRLATVDVSVMIEPINSRIDMPGYWLDDIAKACRLLERIDRPNVRLQYDIYHARIIGGDLAGMLSDHIGRIGHVQVADYPGRHEPGTGDIDYSLLFGELDRLGYDGWVGCEYRPLTTTEAGLGWRPK